MPLTLSKTHPATLIIDDEPVLVHVKRLTKGEAIDFERDYFKYGQPRGTAERTDEDLTKLREFLEESISRYISVAPGQIVDDGREVTSGEDVIRLFCARTDVLTAFYQSIYSQNFLGKALKKIASEHPFFFPGSEQSMAAPNGAPPEPTVTSAESSDSVPSADVTDASSETPAEQPELSGAAVH